MTRIMMDINTDPAITPRKVLMQALNHVEDIDKIVIIMLHKDGETRRRYVCTGSAFMTNALLIDALQPGWDIPS
jgi:3-methyladenine DNA glycosylase Mpg